MVAGGANRIQMCTFRWVQLTEGNDHPLPSPLPHFLLLSVLTSVCLPPSQCELPDKRELVLCCCVSWQRQTQISVFMSYVTRFHVGMHLTPTLISSISSLVFQRTKESSRFYSSIFMILMFKRPMHSSTKNSYCGWRMRLESFHHCLLNDHSFLVMHFGGDTLYILGFFFSAVFPIPSLGWATFTSELLFHFFTYLKYKPLLGMTRPNLTYFYLQY